MFSENDGNDDGERPGVEHGLLNVDHRLPESAYIDVQLHSRWTGIARDDEIYDVNIAIRDFIYDCDSTGVTFYGR